MKLQILNLYQIPKNTSHVYLKYVSALSRALTHCPLYFNVINIWGTQNEWYLKRHLREGDNRNGIGNITIYVTS